MNRILASCLLIAILGLTTCEGQQLEPRRWSHLPMDMNFAGTGFVYTGADISFDPVLQLDDVSMEMQTYPIKYIRSFELFGKSARVDWMQAYQSAQWTGLLNGEPARATREGWSDMAVRFAVNLIGAPPLRGKEFMEYRATTTQETIVGLGLLVQLPTGQYKEEKLLNLGTNRFTFRPQLGVVHRRGKWAGEITGSSWFFTDNDDFFGGNRLEQAALYTMQGHVDYVFRPGLWAGASLGYGTGSESTINAIAKNDRKENLAWMASFGYPFSPKLGIKFSYIGIASLVDVGADSNSWATAISYLW